MNPHVKAILSSLLIAFATGFAAALAPYLESGVVPPSPSWGTILGAALLAGLTSAWQRYAPAPTQTPAVVTTTTDITPTGSVVVERKAGTTGFAPVSSMAWLAMIAVCCTAGALAACALASLEGCSALSSVEPYVPVITGAACTIAADQGAAEPGWLVYLCDVLDPSGKPTGAKIEVHVPKGVALRSGPRS